MRTTVRVLSAGSQGGVVERDRKMSILRWSITSKRANPPKRGKASQRVPLTHAAVAPPLDVSDLAGGNKSIERPAAADFTRLTFFRDRVLTRLE